MPVAGSLLHATVSVVGTEALVMLANRTGHRVTFDVAGTSVTVDGNTTGALAVPYSEDEFAVTALADGGIVPTTFT